MKVLSSLLLVCFLTIVVLAQEGATVSGVVKNLDVQIVKGITVYLESENGNVITTKTDNEGRYKFKNIKDGKYRIKVDDEGLKEILISGERSINVDLVYNFSSSISKQLISSLPEGTVLPEEIVRVKISSGTSQPILEVSKTVNVIDSKEITNRNEFSFTDALRTVPGLRVQQLGGFGKTANIKIRGLRNQDTAILIDGVRFRDASSITGDASAFLSDFTTANFGRIEVLRGSGSSLYGTNAIGGVIDIQTPVPQSKINGSFIGEYGGLGLSRFRGDVGGGTSDGKLAFTTGFSRTNVSEGIDGEDDANNTNLQGRIDYNPFIKTNISGRFYFSDAFVRLNSSPDTFGDIPVGQIIDAREGVNFITDQNDPDSFQRSDFFSGQIALNQIINEKAIFSAIYQGLKTRRENENDVLGIGFQSFFSSIYDGQIHTLNTRLDFLPVVNNRLTFGYEYEWEKFGNDGLFRDGSPEFSTEAKQSGNTFYIQNLLGLLNDTLQIAGGFRFQKFSLKTPTFINLNPPIPIIPPSFGAGTTLPNRFANADSPPDSYTFDGAASYYFDKTQTKFRFHIGNGYRAPSLYERFGSYYFFGGFTFIGNPELEPERSIGIDGGIDQSLFKGRLKFSATYFYTKVKDEITFLPTDDFSASAYFNADRRFSRGLETSAEIKPFAKTSIFTSYTYTNSDERNFQRTNLFSLLGTDQKSFGIPDHQFTLVATQRIGERLSLNFDFLTASNYLAPIFSNTSFSTVTYRFKGNRRADLSGRYEIPLFKEKAKFVIFGTLENIFNYEYFENGFRTEGRTVRGGLGISF